MSEFCASKNNTYVDWFLYINQVFSNEPDIVEWVQQGWSMLFVFNEFAKL